MSTLNMAQHHHLLAVTSTLRDRLASHDPLAVEELLSQANVIGVTKDDLLAWAAEVASGTVTVLRDEP